MVTRKELIEESQNNISRLKADLEKLEQEHKMYAQEHKIDDERANKYLLLSEKHQKMIEHRYDDNWGNYESWFQQKIPLKFEKLADDINKSALKAALNEMIEENYETIKGTAEYAVLNKQLADATWSKFSARHQEIHDLIEQTRDSISWNDQRIGKVETRAGLIEVSKALKEKFIQEEQERKFQENVLKFKKKIIEELRRSETK